MLAYKEPTIFIPTSSLARNKSKMSLEGTNKSVYKYRFAGNDPKCTKSVTNKMKNGILTNWKPRQPDKMIHDILCGRLVQDDLVFQQELVVRSFDIGTDGKMSIVALANYLQETSLNYCESIGLLSDGFSTAEMSKRDLVWVFYKMHIAVDRYPSWHDVVQVNTWIYESGKNGLGVDWTFSDLKTGNTLILASSLCMMMNKKTRKLSKFIKEARMEIKPYFMPNCYPMVENRRKLQLIDIDTADSIRLALSPGWNDLDVNQHVNNVKYIEWIFEGAPSSIMESHQLSSISLEFRKECQKDATLKCLSKYVSNSSHHSEDSNEGLIELEHSLRLHSGLEVARARTMWRPKHLNQS
ncbi:hypothetical protein REPUB_Repub14bG0040100 [Reevesia pubescens]